MRWQVRTLVQRQMSAALQQYDVLVSPVAPTAAFRIGERSADPLAMYKGDLMTVPINLAGILWQAIWSAMSRTKP